MYEKKKKNFQKKETSLLRPTVFEWDLFGSHRYCYYRDKNGELRDVVCNECLYNKLRSCFYVEPSIKIIEYETS